MGDIDLIRNTLADYTGFGITEIVADTLAEAVVTALIAADRLRPELTAEALHAELLTGKSLGIIAREHDLAWSDLYYLILGNPTLFNDTYDLRRFDG